VTIEVTHVVGPGPNGSFACSCGWKGDHPYGHLLATAEAEIDAALKTIMEGSP